MQSGKKNHQKLWEIGLFNSYEIDKIAYKTKLTIVIAKLICNYGIDQKKLTTRQCTLWQTNINKTIMYGYAEVDSQFCKLLFFSLFFRSFFVLVISYCICRHTLCHAAKIRCKVYAVRTVVLYTSQKRRPKKGDKRQ